ncbi:MAG: c-type cytochrome domain-containing protein [Zavarzinella sp.]
MRYHFLVISFLVLTGTLRAAEIDYLKQVKPLLTRCYACHGALKQNGKLRLDTADLAIKGYLRPSGGAWKTC